MDQSSSDNMNPQQVQTQATTPAATPTPPTAPQAQSTETAAVSGQPAAPSVVPCKCPNVNAADWDKKRQKLSKTFHKTFSPRILYYPFSFVIDVDRATRGAIKKGYKPVDGGMVLDTGGMFWGSVLVEVESAKLEDKSVVDFTNKEIYTKVVTRPWNELKISMEELQKELGATPLELYTWWTSCPKCVANREVKAILIAVTAQSMASAAPAQPAQTQQPAAPVQPEQSTQPAAPAEPQPPAVAPEQPAASAEPANPPPTPPTANP